MRKLKPIRNEVQHAEAMREIEALLSKDLNPGTAQFDRLDALTILVEAYESRHPDHRIEDKIDPVEAIKFHMDRLGKTKQDLETILGCRRERVWEILNRTRALTLAQIRALSRELGIPSDRLITEYETKAAKSAKAVKEPKRDSALPPPAE